MEIDKLLEWLDEQKYEALENHEEHNVNPSNYWYYCGVYLTCCKVERFLKGVKK